MSDQNQFDQYKQKLLQYWALFLAGCGTLWEKIKKYALAAADFLSRYAKIFLQKLQVFAKAAADWLRKVWERVRPFCKRLVQTLAGWLLAAKEKSEPVVAKVKAWAAKAKEWVVSQTARFRRRDDALPAPEDGIAEAEAGALVEAAAEAEQASSEASPRKTPAWMSNPAMAKAAAVFAAIGTGIGFVFKWICKLYKLILAAPVVWYAIKFARENMDRLPEQVGLDIQSTGEFARMISRQEAVYWPLGITMFCVLLMFLAKKPILPWVVSIFTLVLPWLIWLLNYYA